MAVDTGGFGVELWVLLALYFLALVAAVAVAAFIQFRRCKEGALVEHYIAGRALGPIALGFSLAAPVFSASTVIGLPAEAYSEGFSAWRCVGSSTFLSIVFLAYAPRLHWLTQARGYDSILSFLGDRFGVAQQHKEPLHWLLVLVFFFPSYIYLCAQFNAFGNLLHAATGGEVSTLLASCGLAAVLGIFEALGGLRAVAFMSVVQGAVLVAASLLILVLLDTAYGGLPAITAQLEATSPGHVAVMSHSQNLRWAEVWIGMGLQRALCPDYPQRAMAAASQNALRMGSAMLAVAPFLVQVPFLFLGIIGRARFPALADPKDTFALMVLDLVQQDAAGRVLGSILMVASIAGVMSTASSVLCAIAQIIALDVVRPLVTALGQQAPAAAGRPDSAGTGKVVESAEREVSAKDAGRRADVVLLWTSRVATVAVAFLCVPLVFADFDLDQLLRFQSAILAQTLPAIVVAMYWRGINKWSVVAGIVVGVGSGVALVAFDIPGGILLSLLANWLTTVTLCCAVPRLASPGSDRHERALRFIFWRTLPPSAASPLPANRKEPVNTWWGLGLVALVLPWFGLPLYRVVGATDPYLSGSPVWAVVAILVLALTHGLIIYIIACQWQGWKKTGAVADGAPVVLAPGSRDVAPAMVGAGAGGLASEEVVALRQELQALRDEVRRLSSAEASSVRQAMREEIGALFA